jgi:hypothetical protein
MVDHAQGWQGRPWRVQLTRSQTAPAASADLGPVSMATGSLRCATLATRSRGGSRPTARAATRRYRFATDASASAHLGPASARSGRFAKAPPPALRAALSLGSGRAAREDRLLFRQQGTATALLAVRQARRRSSVDAGPFLHAPARSRTWIYRLGGHSPRRRNRPNLLVIVGDSAGHPSRGYGWIRRDLAGFGERNWAAAQTRDRRHPPPPTRGAGAKRPLSHG